MSDIAIAAVDLGASSGRVMVGLFGPGRLGLVEKARFPNGPVNLRGTLHWDVLRLWSNVLEGLRSAAAERPASIGIDSWGVDYGLLDATGALIGNPVHYRDRRTVGVREKVTEEISEVELFATTGLQQLPSTPCTSSPASGARSRWRPPARCC